MNRKIVWNLLGLAKIKTGIEDLALSYIDLTSSRYPHVAQKVYVSSGSAWMSLIPNGCHIIEIPRSRFDIGRPIILGEFSHSWAKCISRSDSRIGGSYTIHDWGPFFDKSIFVRQRILWTSTIYRSILRADTIHFLNESFFNNAPTWAKSLLASKKIIFSAPMVNMQTTTIKFENCANYLVAIGTNIPRKNFAKLVQIWSSCGIAERYGLKLIFIGKGTEVFSQNGVVGLGYVSNEDLNNYLYNSSGLICASSYEGQNLPIRDALMLGKPVISTRKASLAYPDDVVVKLDEINESNLLESINRVLNNPSKNRLRIHDTSHSLIDYLVSRH